MRLPIVPVVALAVALVVTATAWALEGGPEVRVNETTASNQLQPVIAGGAGGSLVAWTSRAGVGSFGDVVARRLDAAGTPLGGEIPINETTAEQQVSPSVARRSDGGYAVAWQSYGQDGDGSGIFARLLDPAGNPIGGEIPVNATTADFQEAPAVARGDDGGFAVAWQSYNQDGDGFGIYVRRFDAAGAPLGGEIQVNAVAAGAQMQPEIAPDGEGGFVVVWEGATAGDDYAVLARRVDPSGTALGGDARVNATTSGEQFGAAISAGLGGFLVAWASEGQDGDGPGVYARRLDAAGLPAGGETQVNATTAGLQLEPATALSEEGFLVAWASEDQDGDEYGVYARRLDGAGDPRGGEIQVNETTAYAQYDPALAGQVESGFLAVWTSVLQDGEGGGIYARRFLEPPPEAEPQPAPVPKGAEPDTSAPRLLFLRLTPRVFAAAAPRRRARSGGRRPVRARPSARRPARRVRRSTLVRYRLSEPARVRFVVQRVLPGRRLALRDRRLCVRPTRALVRSGAPRCPRLRGLRPAFVRRGAAGVNRFRLTARLGGRVLPSGLYRLAAVAVDAAGNASARRARNFRIVAVRVRRR